MTEKTIHKIQNEFKIPNKLGLHARAAAKFVKLAVTFSSDVFLIKDEIEANGKSIMSILMLAAEKGSYVTLVVTGSDQDEAFAKLSDLIQRGFDE